MSPRAAARLETLGFTRVFDYVLGKSDWLAAGLPVERAAAGPPAAGDAVRGGDVTCSLDERLGDVAERVQEAGRDAAIVVDAAGVVLGRVRGRNLRADPDDLIEDAMRPGPSTIRPDVGLESVVQMMRDSDVKSTLVTDPDGMLIGTLYLPDAEETIEDDI